MATAPAIKPPYWVKVERKGNDFSGFESEDGQTWKQIGAAVTIVMKDPVFIGLCVTSHVDAATIRTMTFDNVSTTGNVVPAGPFTAWDVINTTRNDPAPLYVALEDKAGKMARSHEPQSCGGQLDGPGSVADSDERLYGRGSDERRETVYRRR